MDQKNNTKSEMQTIVKRPWIEFYKIIETSCGRKIFGNSQDSLRQFYGDDKKGGIINKMAL